MKYRSFALLSLIVAVVFLSGCIYDDDHYQTTPVGYQYIFEETFDNDTRGWAFDDPIDSAYALVQNGEYKFVDYSKAGGVHIPVVATGANVDKNFLVQSRLESNYAMALIFGAAPGVYGYSFYIDDAGYFAVYNEGGSNQSFKTLIDWTESNAIKSGGYNDVAIEQKGNRWHFYINNTEVATLSAQYLSGNRFGFMVLAGTTGYADDLIVKW